jgi:hypothetical protein
MRVAGDEVGPAVVLPTAGDHDREARLRDPPPQVEEGRLSPRRLYSGRASGCSSTGRGGCRRGVTPT